MDRRLVFTSFVLVSSITAVLLTASKAAAQVPEPPTIGSPGEGAVLTTHTPTLSGTGEPAAEVEVFEGATTLCTTTVDGGGAWTCTAASMTNGTHSVSATQTNGDGTSVAAVRGFDIAVPPAIPTIDSPVEAEVISITVPPAASVSFSGTTQTGTTVELFLGGVLACTADGSTGDWACDVSPITAGTHTATAIATDAFDVSSRPTPVITFDVEITVPAPTITAPTDGAALNTATPTISGTAEPGGVVTVYRAGSTVVCSATASGAGAWSCVSPTLTDGVYVFTARVAFGADVSDASLPITVTIDTVAPLAPTVTQPVDGSTGASPSSFAGFAEPGSTVTVTLDGSPFCTPTAAAGTGAWSCVVGSPLADGTYVLRATATDAAGNVSPATVVSFAVETLTTPPPAAPTITSPVEGSFINTSTPTISGLALPGGLVAVFVDGSGTVACSATAAATGAWSCDVSPPLVDGPHSVTAVVTDPDTTLTSDSSVPISFIVDTVAPAPPVVLQPVEGSTGPSPDPIRGTAEPGSTVTVTIVGTTDGCTAVAAAGTGVWSCSLGTVLADGDYTLVANATDAAGNTSADTTVTFTVEAAAPPPTPLATPVITSPASGATLTTHTPSFSGTATAGDTVLVVVDGSESCRAVATVGDTFTCTATTPLSNGTHTAIAIATNGAASSDASAAVVFTISVPAPQMAPPTITSPAPGETIGQDDLIIGTAPPNSSVSVLADKHVVCTTKADANGHWSCEAQLTVGPTQLMVQAIDSDGNVVASAPIEVNVVEGRLAGNGASCSASADTSLLWLSVLGALVALRRRPRCS